jgi:hypothetical protein
MTIEKCEKKTVAEFVKKKFPHQYCLVKSIPNIVEEFQMTGSVLEKIKI